MGEVLIDAWTGCYREGWGRNRLRPASFAHPAKNSYGLSVRIYEHALEEGWIEPGQTLIDIFAGVGGFALEAMRHGLHFVGIELEQRFVDMGQGCDCTGINKADWVRFQGRWDKMRYEGGRHWCPQCLARAGAVTGEREFKPLPLPGTEWATVVRTRQASSFDAVPSASYVRNSGEIPCTGVHHYRGNIETWERQGMAGSAVIVQGDSRRLGEVLARASLCLSSPPYGGNVKSDRTHERRDKRRLGVDFTGRGRGCFRGSECYGQTEGNLGNLPDTGFEAALAMPSVIGFKIRQVANHYSRAQAACEAWLSGSLWGNPIIFSPGNIHVYGVWMRDWSQCFVQFMDKRIVIVKPVVNYTGRQAVLAISSPPFRGVVLHDGGPVQQQGGELHSDYGSEPGQLAQMPEGELTEVVKYGVGQYGERWQDVLAALPEGDHAEACERPVCAISSPPWQGADQRGCPESKWQLMQAAARDGKGHSSTHLPPSMGIDYGNEEGQLGAMPPGDHAAALEAEEPKLVTLGNYGIMSSKMEVIQCQTIAKIAENQYRDVPDVASHVAKNMSAKHSKDVKSQRDLEPKLRQPDSTPQCLIAGEKPILIGKAEVFAGEDTLGKSSAVQPLSEMGTNVSSAVPQIISRFTTKKADQRQMEPGTTNLTTSKPCVLPVTLPCTAPPTLRPLAQYVEKNTEQDHGTLVAQKNAEGNLSCVPSGNSTQKQKETLSTFWAASRQLLEQVYQVLAPGGHAIFVCKRFVRNKEIVDFPLQWARLCEAVGFTWIHHHKAWLVEDRGAQHTLEGGLEKRVVKRLSFFRRLHSQKYPHLEILYEDVLCFVKEA